MDLHHAYRVLPVHADDHPLLGIEWESEVFIDTALSLGLRSAPTIFSAFTDALAWKCLGVPVAMHKTEGPFKCLTFLAIEIDTVAMELSLAPDKLSCIRALVLSWRSKLVATKHELQSLIGHLSHAATVVQHGRTFLRRMIGYRLRHAMVVHILAQVERQVDSLSVSTHRLNYL